MSGDPGGGLLRALLAGAVAAGVERPELVEMTSRDWASATFTGARHAIRLRAGDGDSLAAWLDGLDAAAIGLRGQMVVDVAVMAVERRAGAAEVTVAALTVET